MEERVEHMEFLLKCAILLLTGLQLLKALTGVELQTPSLAAVGVILGLGLPRIGKGFKTATLLFFGMGVSLLAYSGSPWTVWSKGLLAMANVIAIMTIMQCFALPIKLGEYQNGLHDWLVGRLKGERSLYVFTTLATHLFASFLLFGTIPVMISLLGETIRRSAQSYERFVATALSRGYGLVVLWAPGAINVLLVMQATGVSWSQLLMPGLVLSVLGLLLSFSLEGRRDVRDWREGETIGAEMDAATTNRQGQRELRDISLVILGLIASTLLLDALRFGTAGGRILLSGGVVALGWSGKFIRTPGFWTALQRHWQTEVGKTADLAVFFVAMGIFSLAVEQAGVVELLRRALAAFADVAGAGTIFVVPVLLIAAALVGIHPFIMIVMCGKIFTALQLPVPALTLALALSLGGVISYMVSPFAGIVMTLAAFLQVKPAAIALRWNGRYCALLLVLGLAFSYLWGKTFG